MGVHSCTGPSKGGLAGYVSRLLCSDGISGGDSRYSWVFIHALGPERGGWLDL